MVSGSCFCGALQYETSLDDIKGKALCHCSDCHKVSGSTYSTNLIIPKNALKFTKGTPKTISKVCDSGNEITNSFCGDCGSTICREGETFGDNRVLKAGTLDGKTGLENAKPALELYAGQRISWVHNVEGTQDKPGLS
ncbi:hypothetical protein ANO11243_036620 [Dothideomycetidae sp. 11243]|nr:hypothetical protein ANO11243_036620 [fungal sp. No.11243]